MLLQRCSRSLGKDWGRKVRVVSLVSARKRSQKPSWPNRYGNCTLKVATPGMSLSSPPTKTCLYSLTVWNMSSKVTSRSPSIAKGRNCDRDSKILGIADRYKVVHEPNIEDECKFTSIANVSLSKPISRVFFIFHTHP